MDEQSVAYLRNKLTNQYGETLAERIFQGYSVKRKTTLRANTLKVPAQEVADALAKNNISYQTVNWYGDAFILEDHEEKDVLPLPMYESGGIYMQSLSSMLPPLALSPKPGETILDMAAAPGGKTTQIAALTQNQAAITACEFNPARAEKLKFNLQKQGVKRANVMVTDARNLSDFFSFDNILLDAPCTGSGTVDLNDAYSKASYNDKLLKKINSTQLALAQKAFKLLKKGKTMVYSTCSVFREENEDIVRKILGMGGTLVPITPALTLPEAKLLPTTLEGTLCLCPDELFEGFFVAKIRKN